MPHYTSDNPSHIGTRVFLDGEEAADVTQCNTDEGWLIRAVRDEHGKLMLDGPKMDRVATERVYGVVTVIESQWPKTA